MWAGVSRRGIVLGGAALGAAPLAGRNAGAQAPGFPTRPVRIVVPFAPGGPTDVIIRILADLQAPRWEQPVVVENRGGAGTIVGTNAVVQAAPDGYTLGAATNAFVINPAVGRPLPYDTFNALTGVSMVTLQPVVLVANPAFPASNVAELVAEVKRRGEALPFASPGTGGIGHVSGQLLQRVAGISMEHIPYSGSAPALTDVIAGRVPVMFDIWHSARPNVEVGQLKVLAAMGETRLAEAPQYPTIGETFPGLSTTSFLGLFAPAGVPKPLLERISADLRATMALPAFRERVMRVGAEPAPCTPAEFDGFLQREFGKWRDLAQSGGLRVE
ncbi:tripartite tricarboxylate transporter substrate binding protein [Roseomonas sp. BN140053]|uniref:tripartite tricarboxylate transporter substrate binding protein n=1 Tax=Roseomonas sp. BN140053 TaxID=3391898 RepID=UPI0039E9BEF0